MAIGMSTINSLTSAFHTALTNNISSKTEPLAASSPKVEGPSAPQHFATFITDVETDPKFAKEMAQAITFIPDKLLVDLNDAPDLHDAAAMRAWTNQSTEFDSIAAKVTEQRTAIYNDMKSQGATDAEVFKAIVAFNQSLPTDYQIKSGILRLNTYA